MKIQRIAIMLTAINFVIMMILLAQLLPAKAQQAKQSPAILRGRGLEMLTALAGCVPALLCSSP